MKTLVDANVLIALVNRRDQHHAAAVEILPQIELPLLTVWPCLTEAMYIAHQLGGFVAQSHLFGLLQDGIFILHDLDAKGLILCKNLMQNMPTAPWILRMPHYA